MSSTYVNYTQIARDGMLAGLTGQPATYYLHLTVSGINAEQPINYLGDPYVTLAELNAFSPPGAGLNASGYYTQDLSANYINVATTLYNADIILDSQLFLANQNIQTLSGNLAAEIVRAKAAEASLSGAIAALSGYTSAEIASINAGAGLNASGAYIADVSAVYIANASSLFNADQLLNAQLVIQQTNLGNLSGALQAEISRALSAESGLAASISGAVMETNANFQAIELGAGLNSSGAYIANPSAYYIASASSLFNADVLLNNGLVAANTDIITVSGNLANEIARAQAAETGLATNILATNQGAGLNASGAYIANSSGVYIAEAISLYDADNMLDSQLTAVSTVVNAATAVNIPSTLVKRDTSGNVYLASLNVANDLHALGPASLGPTTMYGNSTVNGNFNIIGTLTSIDQTTAVVDDVMVRVANGNATDALYTGFYSQYGNVSGLFASGLVRDPTNGTWILYEDAPINPSGNPSNFSVLSDLQVNSVTSFSDQRLKKDVVLIDGAMEKIRAVRGVYFNWNENTQDQDRQIGVIAQEVQAVLPEVVKIAQQNYLSVDYAKMIPLLIEAIKSLDERVKALELE